MATRTYPYPFVKWAGGKTRMARHILERMPAQINKYFEPFAGGASLFFELSRQKRFRRAALGDMNPELMNAFRIIKDDVDGLIQELASPGYEYDKKRYLAIRSLNVSNQTDVERAARFIYLNKTCFNGLYRVNQSGEFNVPFGLFKDPVICDAENLRAVSKALRKAKLVEKHFDWVLKEARPGDVVYFDPPYIPLSETSNFTSYTGAGFGLAEHTHLSIIFSELAGKGVTTILSNSSTTTAKQLYRDHEIIRLTGSRCIGGPADYRKPVEEIMVVANAPLQTSMQASLQ